MRNICRALGSEVAVGEQQAQFERTERHGARTLVVSGEIDLATAPRFRDELGVLIGESHSPAVIDLSGVSFLDSSGLAALVSARRDVEGTDVTLVLLNPSLLSQRVLEVSGIGSLFEIRHDDLAGFER